MKKIDLDKIVKIEKAISKKYGKGSIINPKSLWTKEKEKKHLQQIKKLYKKEQKILEQCDKIEKDGFFISKNLINKTSKRKCPICNIYSFDLKDDVYVNKFQCCFKCYIQYVEGREDRWLTGWRPNKE